MVGLEGCPLEERLGLREVLLDADVGDFLLLFEEEGVFGVEVFILLAHNEHFLTIFPTDLN